MGWIQIDFISLTFGYVAGIFFCWTLCEVIYGGKDESEF